MKELQYWNQYGPEAIRGGQVAYEAHNLFTKPVTDVDLLLRPPRLVGLGSGRDPPAVKRTSCLREDKGDGYRGGWLICMCSRPEADPWDRRYHVRRVG